MASSDPGSVSKMIFLLAAEAARVPNRIKSRAETCRQREEAEPRNFRIVSPELIRAVA